MARIILDDETDVLTLGGGQWTQFFDDRFFSGEAISPAFAVDDNGDTGTYGFLSMTFEGLTFFAMAEVELKKYFRNLNSIFW